jgi:putative Mn2+ efflux pump MntP
MNFAEMIILSFGLAMDAFAVSIMSGFILARPKIRHALKIGLSFGLFQTFMPVIGWWVGKGFREFINRFDHWIAFLLLLGIGVKMIAEAFGRGDDDAKINPLDFWVLMMLSVATSIDALAVGVSFAFLNIPIVLPVIVIGGVTFSLSFAGVLLGRKLGHSLENKVRILGGSILILIGVKILWEHLRG